MHFIFCHPDESRDLDFPRARWLIVSVPAYRRDDRVLMIEYNCLDGERCVHTIATEAGMAEILMPPGMQRFAKGT